MTPEISSLSNSFKTTSFFNVKLHNLQTETEEKQLQSRLKKIKALNSSSIPVWGWTGSRHKPHTDTDIKTAEIREVSLTFQTEFLWPFTNTRRWTGGAFLFDTDPWPDKSMSQHRLPLATAWELLLWVRPKALGSEELNSSNIKALGQSNFKLV